MKKRKISFSLSSLVWPASPSPPRISRCLYFHFIWVVGLFFFCFPHTFIGLWLCVYIFFFMWLRFEICYRFTIFSTSDYSADLTCFLFIPVHFSLRYFSGTFLCFFFWTMESSFLLFLRFVLDIPRFSLSTDTWAGKGNRLIGHFEDKNILFSVPGTDSIFKLNGACSVCLFFCCFSVYSHLLM